MCKTFEERKDALIDLVDKLPAVVVRKCLALLLYNLITDKVENADDAYIWRSRFRELEQAMLAESDADVNKTLPDGNHVVLVPPSTRRPGVTRVDKPTT